MDFETIKRNIKQKSYNKICEFEADVELIFSNCKLYNDPKAPVYQASIVIKDLYDSLCKTKQIDELKSIEQEIFAAMEQPLQTPA